MPIGFGEILGGLSLLGGIRKLLIMSPDIKVKQITDRTSTLQARDGVYINVSFAQVAFVNLRSGRIRKRESAKDVEAKISFQRNSEVLFTMHPGRWVQGSGQDRVTLNAGGAEKTLAIALKHERKSDAFGYNTGATSYAGYRDPKKRLAEGTYRVNVELTGGNLKSQTFSFILQNPGEGEVLQLGSWEVEMEHQSIIGQTR